MKVLQSTTFSSEAFIVEGLLEQAPHRLLYEGYDRASGQPVLIQHWPTAVIASSEAEERLHQEVAYFQQLVYPYILPISQVLVQQRGISLISPYPRQGSLQKRLSQHSFQPFPLNEARIILWQVGKALNQAHQQGFLHGTLAPGAIFFTEDNQAVVTGFRFQSILEAIPNYHFEQEARLPTIWYMAPEQFAGQLNEKSDQYALGCLAYALLTGHVPFSGYTHATLKRKHQSEPPKLLTTYDPQIPANIEDAILMALAKQPENRHESIQDFLHALEEPVRPHIPSARSLSGIDAALEKRVGSVAEWGKNLPPLRAISGGLSGSLSGIYDKHNILSKMANVQGYSKPASKGKRPYILALVLLFLIVVMLATTLTVFGLSRNATHTTTIPTPIARKSTHHPAPAPTPMGGVHSPPAPAMPTPVPPTPTPAPAIMSCHVAYTVTKQTVSNNSNPNHFTANITITNTGNVDVNNWSLAFTFPDDDQLIDNILSGNAQVSSQVSNDTNKTTQVTIINAVNDPTIAAGQSLTISFYGEWDETNNPPPSFTLNGTQYNTQCN